MRQLDPIRGARTARITRRRRPLRTAVIATAAAVALSGVALPAHAAPGDVTVCASGCDYTTIQAAVSAVSAGTVVSVAPGAYTGSVSITSLSTRGRQFPQRSIASTNTARSQAASSRFSAITGVLPGTATQPRYEPSSSTTS